MYWFVKIKNILDLNYSGGFIFICNFFVECGILIKIKWEIIVFCLISWTCFKEGRE